MRAGCLAQQQQQQQQAAAEVDRMLPTHTQAHSLIHTHAHTQVEAEEDLRAGRLARQQQAAAEVDRMRGTVRELETEVRRCRQEIAAANMR